MRLLLEHGVDPELHGTRRPFYDGRTSSVEAASSGHPDVVELLRNAGATSGPRRAHEFLMACTTPDRARVERLLAADPLQGRPKALEARCGSVSVPVDRADPGLGTTRRTRMVCRCVG